MAKYYVSATRGDDGTGTGTATNPWKTIDKAIGSSPAITLSGSGDTLYIEPGIYRETTSIGLTPSASSPFSIVGDTDGAGFTAGGYATPVTGLVEWRAWTDDTTVISSPALTVNAAPYTTIQRIKFLGGNASTGSCVYVSGASTNVSLLDCEFIGHLNNNTVAVLIPLAAGAWNFTSLRCKFSGGLGTALYLFASYAATEYTINSLVENCLFKGRGYGVQLDTTGAANTAVATGLRIQNCTFAYVNNGVRVYRVTNVNMTTPVGVYGNHFINCAIGIQAYNSSQITADYNAFNCPLNLSNVTAGAHDLPLVSPAVDFGDAQLTGLPYRPENEPSAVSAILGLVSGGSPPSVDITGQARPASPAAGCLEIDSFPTGGTTYIFQTEG